MIGSMLLIRCCADCLLSSIFFLYISLLCCSARDTLRHGEWIKDNGESLVSAKGTFELGFFTPTGSSVGKRFVGIWYHQRTDNDKQTVVWVANRDDPVISSKFLAGSFGLAEDGNLKVRDNNRIGKDYWSTKVEIERSLSTNRTVKLKDSGNLVLSDDDQLAMSSLWESFKDPTDTFLPGMKMDETLLLTSWKDFDDPGTGDFRFTLDQEGDNRYVVSKIAAPYWKSLQPGDMPYAIPYLLSNFSQSIKSNSFFKNTSTEPLQQPNYSSTRLVIDFTGELHYLVRDDENEWLSTWFAPVDNCSIYNACGKFGSCNINNRLICKCLPGFKPTYPGNWYSGDFSGGCTRISTSCGKNDTFLSLNIIEVSYPNPKLPVNNETECRDRCLDDCGSCQAYSYVAAAESSRQKIADVTDSSCWIWTEDLSNLQEEYTNGGRSLSVRVATSDIESTERNCEPCGTYMIPYPLSTRQNCGDPMYSSFHCDTSRGQVSFKAPSGIYRVSNIDSTTLKFVVQVDTRNPRGNPQLDLSLPFYISGWVTDASGNFSSKVPDEVEISWGPAPEPTCNSTADCMDWPHSTCNATRDGKRRCLCTTNFRWNGSLINCTGEGDIPAGSLKEPPKRKTPSKLIVAVTVTSVIVLFLLCTIVSIYIWKRKMAKRQEKKEANERNKALRKLDSERHVKDLIDSSEFKEDESIDVPFFDLESILVATDNFSDANKLGQGGYGPVYKGKFPGGQEIAVKRLSSVSGQGLHEFKNEVVLIAKLQHRNLVKLRGYCIKGDEKILLYEYMPNKSLDSFIFDQKQSVCLNWEMRFNIIMGIARGLLYLHQDSRLRIIHRDLKTSNVLLDEDMNPKISDFGLARIVGGKETEANTTRVVGTYGYMSPEYALDGTFSVKSDVFSFGVVLLEIISGIKNTGFYRSEQALSLLGYVWRLWTDNKVLDLMDQTLQETCNANQFMKCVKVGLLCVQEDPSDRPTMSNVLTMLDSETATIPTPRQPAFVLRRGLSSTASSSIIETHGSLTTTLEEAR